MEISQATSTLANVVAILGGAGYLGRKLWQAAGTVKDNTKATEQLSEEFAAHRADVTAQLADHTARLARLEHAP